MSEKRHAHVVNVEEAPPIETGQGGFASRRRRLSQPSGGGALGCSHFEVPPGKTAFPFHFHSNIEEAIFVLEGRGTARIGKDTIEVRAGDYLAYPPGPDVAHSLTNTGDVPLRYLALSSPTTAITLDIVGYPDSKKVAFAAGADPQKGLLASRILKIVKEDQPSLGYYDDEPLAEGR